MKRGIACGALAIPGTSSASRPLSALHGPRGHYPRPRIDELVQVVEQISIFIRAW